MRLLLTNDDGIDAPGLAALFKAARPFGDPLVIAPALAHSGCGHRVTTDEAFRVIERSPGRIAVQGTPADCVRAGLHCLAQDAAWVLAGINAGGNLGTDVYHSGTVAAAREAVLHGRPAIAFSYHRRKGMEFDWDWAADAVCGVLRDLLSRPCPARTFWNVNLPHLHPGAIQPAIVHCELDTQPLPLSFQREGDLFRYDGNYHERQRDPTSDVAVCFGGQIAVTRMLLS